MTLDTYNTFCATLPHAHSVVQWGGAHVWKIRTKVFSFTSVKNDDILFVNFKCSPMSYDVLREQPGLTSAPYLASRGMKWLQRQNAESMDEESLKDYLRESYRLASLNLPKRDQKLLGLNTLYL